MRPTRLEFANEMSKVQEKFLADGIDVLSIPEEDPGTYLEPSEETRKELSPLCWDEEVVQESHREIAIRAWRAASGRRL